MEKEEEEEALAVPNLRKPAPKKEKSLQTPSLEDLG